MKSLLITTSLTAAIVGPVWANDSTIDQIGMDNVATVTQNGGSGGTSGVLQTGDDDTAWVIQSETASGGTNTNTSEIKQLGGSGSQSASVNQNYEGGGAANMAFIIQDSTDGGNLGTINQNGNANSATIAQGPGDSDDVCLGPFCFGTTPFDITNSTASVLQEGAGNIATSNQIVGSNGGNSNFASTEQYGDLNIATINQGSGTSLFDPTANDNDNEAYIKQDGIGNESSMSQGGELGVASSAQFGNDNKSEIVQSGGFPLLAAGNNATVFQDGDRNSSIVRQSSAHGDLPAVPAGTKAIVTQLGSDNESIIDQKPLGGHLATVNQDGSMLSSLIEQDGLFNTASLTQELANQESEIFQTGPLLSPAIGNTAEVSQTATANNFSHVTQSGSLNTTTVLQ